MLVLERQQRIIACLRKRKSVSVTELVKSLYVSGATIRRDLRKLEAMGLLKRTHGGAVLLEGLDMEIPLSVRETEQKDEKAFIGQSAAGLVHDGQTLILDSSSTTLRMVPHLSDKINLVVITNGAKTAIELGDIGRIKVYCTGGKLRENSLSYCGQSAQRFVENYQVDTVFFSCRAVHMEKGLYDANEEEAELRRAMMRSARKSVLLCDHTKFDKTSFCRIGGYDQVHCIVCDQSPGEKWETFLQNSGVELIYS